MDLHIFLGELPGWSGLNWGRTEDRYSTAEVDSNGQPTLAVSKFGRGAWFRMRYADGTEFLIDRIGSRLWARWPESLTLEDTATYLLGPVMGFVLLLRGTHALHASAVSVDGHGIAIVGAAGYGKSTTAAAFAKLGYSVMAEDVAALGREHGKFVVHPAYPCIRLWPESVNALFGAPDALPPLTPNWDKRYLELEGDRYRFQSAPLPLGAIYLLSERQDDASSPRIEAIAPKAGMLELIANAYAPHMKDRAARAQEFELLRKVVAEVPLRRVIPSTRLTEVHRLCDVILEDFRTLPFRGDSNRTPESCECL